MSPTSYLTAPPRGGDTRLYQPRRSASPSAPAARPAAGKPPGRASVSGCRRACQHQVARRNTTPRCDDVVDQAVVQRFSRGHEVVPVDVVLDFLDAATTVKGDDLGHPPGRREHFT